MQHRRLSSNTRSEDRKINLLSYAFWGTYLITAELSHAEDNSLHKGTVIGSFNGEFWSMFAGHQVIGNLLSLALLRDGEGDGVTGKNLYFTVFLVCMIFSIVMLSFLSKRDNKRRDKPTYTSLRGLLKSSFAPLLDKNDASNHSTHCHCDRNRFSKEKTRNGFGKIVFFVIGRGN